MGGYINFCYNTGDISSYGNGNVGGIAGWSSSGYITNCANFAVTSSNGENTGGIIGWNNNSSVNTCYNAGTINGGSHTGGISGRNINSNVDTSYSSGSVFGHDYVGGISGRNTNSTVEYCVSLGKTITGNSNVARITVNGTMSDNRARAKMTVTINGTVFPVSGNANDINGEDVPYGTWLSDAFGYGWWQQTWNMPGTKLHPNCELPSLRNIADGQPVPRLE